MAGFTFKFEPIKPMNLEPKKAMPRVFSVTKLPWEKNDGGRAAAGYKGRGVGDCVIRAIAIATGENYKDVYKAIYAAAKASPTFHQAINPKKCSPRFGCYMEHYKPYLESRGWKYVEADALVPENGKITTENIAAAGTVILHITRHLMVVKDGVVLDSHAPHLNKKPWVLGAFVKMG